MTYTTSFRDIAIDSVPTTLFSGIATWEWDEVYEDFFVQKLEVYNLFGKGSVVNLRRVNRDRGLSIIFSEIEDALLDQVSAKYDSPSKHWFYEALTQ